ncbi:class I SAM-dependent methyltransferase [Leifsonia sp. Root112D2]|uniref:class I SAM-dependent methyltransferase n=1 Tax=Leifsonia sp. Root112D2 TaxID=1736426 RepID=UPI0006F85401|nr:class I SAM-dependent methyltransferase [Leifsonia sp. Root112D2]KQV07766.1 hypothetical protein ASC63_11235 [Leifsonia sp. Root112D2]
MIATAAPTASSLFGSLTGTVLEIGAGRGANFSELHDIDWIGLEPNGELIDELRRGAEAVMRNPRVIRGFAESIPLDDASVDAVIGSFVLCSVDDQKRSLEEIRRVLRPGGRYVFVEHVAASRGWKRRFQRCDDALFARSPGECHVGRDTLAAIKSSFERVDATGYVEREALGIGWPHIAGTAFAD